MYSHHQTKKIISIPKLLLTTIFLSTLLSYSFLAFNSNSKEQTSLLAEKVFEKYQTFLQREDIKALLPIVLVEIKKPENQAILIPETISLVVDNPELIKRFFPDIDDEYITFLKEDEEVQTFLRDTDVHALLQDLNAIDELATILNVKLVLPITVFVPVNQRTQQVQDAIVAAIPGVNSANDVTKAHVAAITFLNLSSQSITSLKSGDFDGFTALKFLFLYNNSISDISALEDLTSLQILALNDNAISDISALEDLTSLTILYLNGNSISDMSALKDLTSLMTLTLSGNPISDYRPLRTLKATIEAANSSIYFDININNNPPVFTDGSNTTRSVAENTAAGQNIGNAIAATDADNHTLTYSLGGTNAASFDIVSSSGQLQTKAALDYETKTSYTVTVTAYDGNSGADIITVTIDVTDDPAAAPSVEAGHIIPDNTDLLTNFPNPFNPETWIPYQLAKPAEVTLTIYNMRGVVVRTIALGHKATGMYTNRSRAIHWDGRNSIGEKVATGVYFYTLKAGDFNATRKLLIRK